jgi:hypothetical protein
MRLAVCVFFLSHERLCRGGPTTLTCRSKLDLLKYQCTAAAAATAAAATAAAATAAAATAAAATAAAATAAAATAAAATAAGATGPTDIVSRCKGVCQFAPLGKRTP